MRPIQPLFSSCTVDDCVLAAAAPLFGNIVVTCFGVTYE